MEVFVCRCATCFNDTAADFLAETLCFVWQCSNIHLVEVSNLRVRYPNAVLLSAECHCTNAKTESCFVVCCHSNKLVVEFLARNAVCASHKHACTNHDVALTSNTSAYASAVVGGEVFDNLARVLEFASHEYSFVRNENIVEEQVSLCDTSFWNIPVLLVFAVVARTAGFNYCEAFDVARANERYCKVGISVLVARTREDEDFV